VKSDFDAVFGTTAASFGPIPYTAESWLAYAAYRFASADKVHVWITVSGGQYSNGPNGSRQIKALAGYLNTPGDWNLAHEMGHYFGLAHTDGELRDQFDPVTNAAAPMSESWDLVYKPGTSTTAPHQWFTSRTDAAIYESVLQPIDQNTEVCSPTTCSCNVDIPTNTLTCAVGVAGGWTELWYHDEPRMTNGLTRSGVPFGTKTRSTNIMSYNSLTIASSPQHLAASQVRQIKRNVRFDTTCTATGQTGCGPVAGYPGLRPLLGNFSSRRPLAKLDFDNDGRRDFAIWQPPSSPSGTGSFSYALSTALATTVAGPPLGLVGDIPVPADYDGDGLTDFALYRPGGSPGGLSLPTDGSTWVWCKSSLYGPGKQYPFSACTESTATKQIFGQRQDIPLPGLDSDGVASTTELGIYRPATNTFTTWRLGGGIACIITTPSTVRGGGQAPFPCRTCIGQPPARRSPVSRSPYTIHRRVGGTWCPR